MNDKKIKQVMKIGLSDIEARIYLYLLGNSPATGYKIARGINKQVANTYQSLSEMIEKGLLYLDKGQSKMYCAIPYDELLSRLKKDYTLKVDKANEIFSEVNKATDYSSIYSLKSKTQVLDKFYNMMSKAKDIAIVDLYPSVEETFRNSIIEANNRGVNVFLKTYDKVDIKNINTVFGNKNGHCGGWPGSFINVIIDFKELLLSFFGEDGKNYAVWSRNSLIALAYGNGLMNEIMVDNFLNNTENVPKEFVDHINTFRKTTIPPLDVVASFIKELK